MKDQTIIPNAVPLKDRVGEDLSSFLPNRMPRNATDQKKLANILKLFKNKKGVSPETIREARRLCMPRPDHITEDEWNQAVQKDVNYQQRLAIYMLAWGMPNVKVAQSIGSNPSTIVEWKKNPVFLQEVSALQMEIFGRDPVKAIKNLIPSAIGRVAETMNDEKVKAQTRLSAAQDILDRGMGKAVQKVNIEETSLRKVIENLDAIKRNGSLGEILDAEFSDVTQELKDVTQDATQEFVSHKKELTPDLDAADAWIRENI